LARFIKWGLFIFLAGLLAWRIVVLGMSEYYSTEESEQSGDSTLAWHAAHPVGLQKAASDLLSSDPHQADILVRQAIQKNPSNGRNWMTLALLYEKREDEAHAMLAVARAIKLSPMQSGVQLDAGAFWLRHNRADFAIKNLDHALRVRGSLESKIFPLFLRLVEDPRARPFFAPVVAEEPRWWKDFYQYVAANALNLDTVRDLYQMRETMGRQSSSDERMPLLERLQKDGRWLEAYFIWLNSLPRERLNSLGNLFNGNFEHEISSEGFDWIVQKVSGATVENEPTYGTTGSKALHVELDGQRLRFQHLYQYLMLDPGKYFLRGRVRLDNLLSEKGLQWVVRCVQSTAAPLGESEYFVGADQWKHFSASFEVPKDGCQAQMLRLELGGRSTLDFIAEGSIWFDDMEIERENVVD
jgi:tetratricopeptide (TPR) repeat protein